MSFRSRMLASLLVVGLVATAVTAGFSLTATSVFFSNYASGQRAARAREMASVFGLYYERVGSWDGVQALLAPRGPGVGPGPGARTPGRWAVSLRDGSAGRVLLLDNDGRVVADSSGTGIGQAPSLDGLEHAPVVADGEVVGTVAIVPVAPGAPGRVAIPLEQSFKKLVVLAAVVAAAAGTMLSVLLGASYSRDLTRRVGMLAEASRRLARRDLSVRLPAGPHDELGELAATFNDMAGALQKAEDLRRNMVSDMAHEIRTPLAILQSNLEAIQAGAVDPSPETIASLQEEVLRMSRLVADLQDLSLSEAGRLPLFVQETDVAEVLERAVLAMRAQAREKSIVVTSEARGQARALADPDRLMQVVMNLLANAVRYTPSGGTVGLVAGPDDPRGASVRVSVSNTGEPIPEEDLPRLFERFYRGDKSRARQSGGAGLGLAVAKALVELMGGRIWAESSTSLTSFCFTLPAAPSGSGTTGPATDRKG
ncbi:MAG: ATP-binding protein [Ignavibacteriales bacterium]